MGLGDGLGMGIGDRIGCCLLGSCRCIGSECGLGRDYLGNCWQSRRRDVLDFLFVFLDFWLRKGSRNSNYLESTVCINKQLINAICSASH